MLFRSDQAAANYEKLNADRVQAFINAHLDRFSKTGKSDTEVKDTVGPYNLSWSSYIIIQVFLLANVLAVAAVVWSLVP